MGISGRLAIIVGFGASYFALAQTADTISTWNGVAYIGYFGGSNLSIATFGQTVTIALTPVTLQSFTFELGCDTAVTYRAEVYAWDFTNRHITGPALYESAPSIIPQAADNTTFTPITVNTGGVVLGPGTYVLFFTTSKDPQGISVCRWGSTGDVYTGGNLFFSANLTNFGVLSTTPWFTPGLDSAFQMNTTALSSTPTPIPSTILLTLTGIIGVALWGWSQRSARTTFYTIIVIRLTRASSSVSFSRHFASEEP